MGSLEESACVASIYDVIDDVTTTMTSYSLRHNIQSRRIRKLAPGTVRVDHFTAHTIEEHCV